VQRRWKELVRILLKSRYQKKTAHRLEKPFEKTLRTIHDPDTRQVLDNAAPYLHSSFRGEAVLSIGKALDMVGRMGAAGIINAMPFGCMPGTVVTALLRSIAQQKGFPTISLPFDGTASSTMQLQLEAFMEQARQRVSA
jgi:predicted nucleotide-binding protein (sugar kinase/HSP70/actin superfamily)